MSGEEFDVVDVDNQRQNGFIKVKDLKGNIIEVFSYHFVERVVLE
jgi:hypothetical protein